MGAYHEALARQIFDLPASAYGWVITKDHLNDGAEGVLGPSDVSDEIEAQLKAGKGVAFRIYDDDGELYYSGRFVGDSESDDAFGPLSDYGAPNAGATEIRYMVNHRWTTL